MTDPMQQQLNELKGKLDAAEKAHASLVKDYTAAGEALNEERGKHDRACQTIADMHAAAMGKVCGPDKGVVQDVEALRQERDRLLLAVQRYQRASEKVTPLLAHVDGDDISDADIDEAAGQLVDADTYAANLTEGGA